MGTLDGKVALVTGAGRGIGAGIARRLAQAGAKVIVNYGASETDAAELVRQLGGCAKAVRADISQIDEIDSLRAAIEQDWGAIDILVNNAGTGTPGRPSMLADLSVEDFDRLYAVNTRAVFFVTQRMLPIIRDGGTIINISSTTVTGRRADLSAYAGSKAAVEAFTRNWSIEVAPRRITVNSVAPGLVDTDMLARNLPAGTGEAAAAAHPLGRIGQPVDIANVVAFLAGDDAKWVNGQTIVANGGMA